MKRTMALKTVAVSGCGIARIWLPVAATADDTDRQRNHRRNFSRGNGRRNRRKKTATDECASPTLRCWEQCSQQRVTLHSSAHPSSQAWKWLSKRSTPPAAFSDAPVTYIEGDSGETTTTDIASQTVDSQLAQGVQAIIGAASSGVSLTVIDKITSNGVVQFSPANTAPALTTYADNGLYFRNSPSDVLQGAVIAAAGN